MKKLIEKRITFKYEKEEGYLSPDFYDLITSYEDGVDVTDYREYTMAEEIIYDCPFSVGDEVILVLDIYDAYAKGTIGTVKEVLSDYTMCVEMKTKNGDMMLPTWGIPDKSAPRLTDIFVKVRR